MNRQERSIGARLLDFAAESIRFCGRLEGSRAVFLLTEADELCKIIGKSVVTAKANSLKKDSR